MSQTRRSPRTFPVMGILGGGQLGQMLAMAALPLGIRTLVLDPDPFAPAKAVANHLCAPYEDPEALKQLIAQSDLITYEFEHVPPRALALLESLGGSLVGGPLPLETAANRAKEKALARSLGIETAAYRLIEPSDEAAIERLNQAREALKGETLLKSLQGGYDGKGQCALEAFPKPLDGDALLEVTQLLTSPCILEKRVDFEREISITLAQNKQGIAVLPLAENHHRGGILHHSFYPAPLENEQAQVGLALSYKLAQALKLQGTLSIEWFLDSSGRWIFNEMAPRVHNSAHASIECTRLSQFELHVRALFQMPLSSPCLVQKGVMRNLLGEEILALPALQGIDWVKVHDYGKRALKTGRKMGHATALLPLDSTLSDQTQALEAMESALLSATDLKPTHLNHRPD